jgi:phosphoribosyl 1,2-cyclic phosphate phosphodiesterase
MVAAETAPAPYFHGKNSVFSHKLPAARTLASASTLPDTEKSHFVECKSSRFPSAQVAVFYSPPDDFCPTAHCRVGGLQSTLSWPVIRALPPVSAFAVPKQVHTRDFTGEMILLGTGTSVGVPAIGCGCPVCLSRAPKNQRTRASAILGLPGGNLVLDTSPDLRQQLLREGIGIVHAVVYTHEHSDHVMGFDDLRLFQFYLGHPVPIFCRPEVRRRIETAFDYAFSGIEPTHAGAAPAVNIEEIDTAPFDVLGETLIPIPLKHGPRFDVLGFRIGRVAYCTDVSEIPASSWPLLENLDVLVIDALRPTPHPTHLSIDQAVEIAQRLQPKKTYFTHCSCHIDYQTVNASLPAGIEVGYDGLRIPLT